MRLLLLLCFACGSVDNPAPHPVASGRVTPTDCTPLASESAVIEAGIEPDRYLTTTMPGPCVATFESGTPENNHVKRYQYENRRLRAVTTERHGGTSRVEVTTNRAGVPLSVRGNYVVSETVRGDVQVDFVRDACGKLIERVWGDQRTIYAHDDRGRIISEQRFVGDELQTRAAHHYTEDGLERSVYEHPPQSRTGEFRYRYSGGRLVEIQTFSSGRAMSRTHYQYDALGRRIRDEVTGEVPNHVVTREFDDEGNELREVVRRGERLLWTRTLDYSCHR